MAWVFIDQLRRSEVEAFCPTIYSFRSDGPEALARSNVEPCYVDDLDTVIDQLKTAGIYCDVQS